MRPTTKLRPVSHLRRPGPMPVLPKRLAPLALALCLVASGCRAPREESVEPYSDRFSWVSESVQGRDLLYHTFGSERAETILFVATLHGDEPAGKPLLEVLMEKLATDPALTAYRRAIVIPLANPDGFELETRRNARDIDINANFAASTFLESPVHGAFAESEPETRFLRQVVERFRPTGILTFHQDSGIKKDDGIIDFNGPAAGWAYRLGRACDELEVRRLGARPGSIGDWAGDDLGIRVLTIELPRETNDLEPEEIWELYGGLVLEALK